MAIVRVEIRGDQLLIEPQGINKLWGLRRSLRFPLGSITAVSVNTTDFWRRKGIRLGALGWTNRWVGRFYFKDKNTYWCAVTGPTLEIRLRDQDFDSLVLSPDNPKELANGIIALIG